jgi:hypothetical protein
VTRTTPTFRYKLRTLLIALTLGPPMLAGCWWNYSTWRAEQRRVERLRAAMIALEAAQSEPGPLVAKSGNK